MALSNVAWTLAANGKRVLMIDWDLEAPGLHKYFAPFLHDAELQSSDGLIDFVIDYVADASRRATAAASIESMFDKQEEWLATRANLLRFAVPISWEFPEGGRIDFVPSGRQGPSYAARVNSFDWASFYERLHGARFLDLVIGNLRAKYDFVLVDSRTGVSDTSGICTVQAPDALVVFFTLNNQSISGASAVARSALAQRTAKPLRVFPVPTRTDLSEKKRLEAARTRAHALFYPLLGHVSYSERKGYWNSVEIPYEAFYAYEEVLAIFAEQGTSSQQSMLVSNQRLAEYISGSTFSTPIRIPERQRREVAARFGRTSKSDLKVILESLALEYEEIRKTLKSGPERTRIMTELVSRVAVFSEQADLSKLPRELFAIGRDGTRLVALALLQPTPQIDAIDLATEVIRNPRSPFEQFNALVIVDALFEELDLAEKASARAAIESQIPSYIKASDSSRWSIAQSLLLRTESVVVAQDSAPIQQSRAELERAATHIQKYLDRNHFEMVSFERVRGRINEKYTDDFLKQVIDDMPERFRRARLKGDKPGIALARGPSGEHPLKRRQ
jgi:hypothetical protein